MLQKFDIVCHCVVSYRTIKLRPKIVQTTLYRGADKSLVRPGRKHVRYTCDFNNIETRAVIKFFFPASQGAEGNSRHSDRNISLFLLWSG